MHQSVKPLPRYLRPIQQLHLKGCLKRLFTLLTLLCLSAPQLSASAASSSSPTSPTSATSASTATSEDTALQDIPLIELYPFVVWYQRQSAEDILVVQDPRSGKVSRFESLGFSEYPKFHLETLGGRLHLRLAGRDLTGTQIKQWYLDPASGKTSALVSPLSTGTEPRSDQFLHCDGQQQTHWVALPTYDGTTSGVGIFDLRTLNNLSDWNTPTLKFPLPTVEKAPTAPKARTWRTCYHRDWAVAYDHGELYLYDIVQRQRFDSPYFTGETQRVNLLNLMFRQEKLWVWWRREKHKPRHSHAATTPTAAITQTEIEAVYFHLAQFDLKTHQWQDYPAQTLPFLPLQDLETQNQTQELLLGPPWLPSQYRAPYFRLNTTTGVLSEAIWVENIAPGQLAQREAIFNALPPLPAAETSN